MWWWWVVVICRDMQKVMATLSNPARESDQRTFQERKRGLEMMVMVMVVMMIDRVNEAGEMLNVETR